MKATAPKSQKVLVPILSEGITGLHKEVRSHTPRNPVFFR